MYLGLGLRRRAANGVQGSSSVSATRPTSTKSISLTYLAEDEKTSVIAMYLEDISNGRRFIETARKIFWQTSKPMLCLKSGRSPEGARPSAATPARWRGPIRSTTPSAQSGVQRVDTIAELFDYAALYTTQPLPKGNRIAIITNAGGPGIMATDAAVRHGLKLAELSEATRDHLRKSLPAAASLRNPIDVIGDARADRYQATVRTVLQDENVDMAMVILTPQSMTEVDDTAAVVPEALKGIGKPVVCSFMGAGMWPRLAILRTAGVPNYTFPEDGIKSLAAAVRLVTVHVIPRREVVEFDDVDAKKAGRLIAAALDGQTSRYLSQAGCRPISSVTGSPSCEATSPPVPIKRPKLPNRSASRW